MLWWPSCPQFCVTDMSEININMLCRFFDPKNLSVVTRIMFLVHILQKILRILSFSGPYFYFPNDAKASFRFNVRTCCRTQLCKNILWGLFLGNTQNFHFATRLLKHTPVFTKVLSNDKSSV